MFEVDSRQILIYLAVKYDGDPCKIVTALQLHEDIKTPVEEVIRVCNSLPYKAITFLDYDYPKKLKDSPRAPFVLFYYGDITLLSDKYRKCGFVGSRDYSKYGEKATKKIISELGNEVVIVSGLAKGIDTLAHQAAIDNHLRTIAVLGSGIDNCYPTENKELYEILKKEHLVISEYPGMSEPAQDHFPRRNRIIVGLSDCVVVPQVNTYQSGTMISIGLCANQNKPLFVVPHPFFAETINNDIIREGASLVESGAHILEDMNWS